MSTQFEFNAPQFVDFNSGLDDSDGADTFFDVENNDSPPKAENKENLEPNNETIVSIKQEFSTPENELKKAEKIEFQKKSIKKETESPMEESNKPNPNSTKRDVLKAVRRLSATDCCMKTISLGQPLLQIDEKLSEDLENLTVALPKPKRRSHFDGIELNVKEEKPHPMTTRNDKAESTSTLQLRTRTVCKEEESDKNRKRKAPTEQSLPDKYMAMAERILHFQKDTPPRFHTNRRRTSGTHCSMLKARKSYKPRRTVALTPKLMTAQRSRPVDGLSQEDREEQELEEIRKNQIKAAPLNEKIFEPPNLPLKPVRHSTVIEPFKLTDVGVFKKPAPKTEEEAYKFTARPVRKDILAGPVGVAPRAEIPLTVPQSPAITKSARHSYRPVRVATFTNDNVQSSADVYGFGVPMNKLKRSRNTDVKPFSFEVRDKEIMEKKERKIQEILEAERKAREFKANPPPSFAAPKETNRSSKNSVLDCSKASVASTITADEAPQPFRARSPRVLRQKAFKPTLPHLHSEPLDIRLNTERRLEERREYEMRQALKDQEMAILREQMEAEKKMKEQEEIARIRQEAVHKANPMPKYPPPPKAVQSCLPLTDPQSPCFTRRIRGVTPSKPGKKD